MPYNKSKIVFYQVGSQLAQMTAEQISDGLTAIMLAVWHLILASQLANNSGS